MRHRCERPPEANPPAAATLSGEAMSRRQFLASAGAGAALLPLPGRSETAFAVRGARSMQPGGSVVLHWNEAFLQGVRDSKLDPPMVARALAI
jgi:hypothetical protein